MEATMRKKTLFLWAGILIAAMGVASVASAAMTDKEKKAAQQDVQKMAKETLNQLYKTQPKAKQAVAKAAGYAVFSNFGLKIFLAGSGQGKGMAVNNRTKAATYMKMLEVQAGLGFGVKKFKLVWVFENQRDLNDFINSGWELGGQAGASAKTGETGMALEGAMSVSPGVWLYQLTDDGLALELTAKGTKYYKDDELN
jgi:lipid-binding SYLF domain-containing protein